MISLIYGPKGTGKTKIILDRINESAKETNGNVVFIAEKRGYSVAIDFSVKCVYANEFGINSVEQLRGFVKGLIAGNSDITYLFIDGVARITKTDLSALESLFEDLEVISSDNEVNIVMTISSDLAGMPDFIKKYVK